MKKTVIEYTTYNEKDEEVVEECPAKYAVCPRCDGKGTHVNPSVDGHGISREEFDQDPDFEEAYFDGVYDVVCYECKGERVILVPDEDSPNKDAVKKYTKWRREQDRYERERQHEIDMGY